MGKKKNNKTHNKAANKQKQHSQQGKTGVKGGAYEDTLHETARAGKKRK